MLLPSRFARVSWSPPHQQCTFSFPHRVELPEHSQWRTALVTWLLGGATGSDAEGKPEKMYTRVRTTTRDSPSLPEVAEAELSDVAAALLTLAHRTPQGDNTAQVWVAYCSRLCHGEGVAHGS